MRGRIAGFLCSGLNRQSLEHAARTTLAATLSLALAQGIGLPEAQWAAVSAMVVTQSTLGATLTISGQRLAGTALGAVAAALLATRLSSSIPAFAAGVFGLGMTCALLHLDRAAYRFGGITLAIVVLGSRPNSAWIVAAYRFSEVSLGIATALAIIALWRERQSPNDASPAGPGPRS
jgi:uncharacterized membrane protein YccC